MIKKMLYVGGAIFGICTGTAFLLQAISNTCYLASFGRIMKRWERRADNLYRIAEPGILKSTVTMVEDTEESLGNDE